jgi:hypothetical protein
MTGSPFIPGVRVAVEQYGRYAEDFVAKVHKNGNFTLRGDPRQQYRSYQTVYSGNRWHARQTGGGYYHKSVLLWDEETDAEIKAKLDEVRRLKRLRAIQDRIHSLRVSETTNVMLDQIEAALVPAERVRP